ncbi:DUF5994 family protein [Nocardia acidivorans]|uniref:DUF5994 family protein n=1 Tax=Nocardia acidivorans TaxID=404580 RepID=UPI000A01F8DC|nr:DUF5994 family protein [Nocardia acidivorans]
MTPIETVSSRTMPSARNPRLELDAVGTAGADIWRPRSRDLAEELPALLTTLARLGPILRVIYNLDEWAAAPRKLDFDGHRVRLDGYRQLPAHTLEVLGVRVGTQLTLQIIPPLTDTEMTTAQQRWDSEGGAGADT